MIRLFTDFHHSSLLRATNMLFGDRLHMMVYRPIGVEWYDEGYWAINNQPDTAKQFLDLDQAFTPGDNTPALNKLTVERDQILGETQADGVYYCADPGNLTAHRACTLEFFKNNRFDYVIASIPAHVPLYEDLIRKYQPTAKLIIQMGNNWNIDNYAGKNVLASIAPTLTAANAYFYHQEFDTEIFRPTPVVPSKNIYSFVNVIQNTGIGWNDFLELERALAGQGFNFKAYGGQCRDGNKTGPRETAISMRAAQFIFHVKPGGDGYGHVIHNAYAVGRPVITRASHYAGQLAERLFIPGTFIDLDKYGRGEVKNIVTRLTYTPDELAAMGARAAERFREVVNFEHEAQEIKEWLGGLS